MYDRCPFLGRKPSQQGLPYCMAGVDFYTVGQARELCQLCPLADGGWTPTCEFLEVHTYLRVDEKQPRIEVRFDCRLPEGEATQPRCAACPAAGAPLPHPHGTPEVQPVQAVVGHRLRESL